MVRTRAGPAAVTSGVLGLAAAWWVRDAPAASGVLAALAFVVLTAGLLVAARARGEAPTRIAGGLLCLAGLAVVITQHQLWWWLPTGWETPVTVASLLIAAAGFGTLLFAYGFRMAGLSGACGVLAVVCLGATLLPYLGSEDKAVLRTLTASLGAVALVAGLRAAGRRRPGPAGCVSAWSLRRCSRSASRVTTRTGRMPRSAIASRPSPRPGRRCRRRADHDPQGDRGRGARAARMTRRPPGVSA